MKLYWWYDPNIFFYFSSVHLQYLKIFAFKQPSMQGSFTQPQIIIIFTKTRLDDLSGEPAPKYLVNKHSYLSTLVDGVYLRIEMYRVFNLYVYVKVVYIYICTRLFLFSYARCFLVHSCKQACFVCLCTRCFLVHSCKQACFVC